MLESAITLIDGRSLYYRGQDAAALSRTKSIDEVAVMIWGGAGGGAAAASRSTERSRRLGFVGRAQAALAQAAAADPSAFDVRPERVVAAGRRILETLVAAATGADPAGEPIDSALGRAWRVAGRGTAIIRAALILCADHELNVSSFTARCIASAGSGPYAVVLGGLAALEGPRHGGASARVEAMLDSMRRTRDLDAGVAARLQRGETIDGFGHPLYPDGDPRAATLLDLLRASYPRSAELAFVRRFARAAENAGRGRPNLDFALAAAVRVLRLPPGSPLVLFAIGRTIGWIGHAIEQYATGQLIRPRARYTGDRPG